MLMDKDDIEWLISLIVTIWLAGGRDILDAFLHITVGGILLRRMGGAV